MRREAVDYLMDIPCWFLATAENGKPAKPHVRPFSFATIDDGRICFCTAVGKDVYDQLKENPWFELSGWKPGYGWIVLAGRAVMDIAVSETTRKAGYEHMTALGETYEGWDDTRLTFFTCEDARASFADIDGSVRPITLEG
jgi:uncharacterized pyridoxamine 5'-phosphate oxidase family protein